MDWGEKWLVDFNSGKTQFVSCNWSINSFSISFKMDGSALERKSFFKMFQDCLFFYELNWGSYVASFISKKIGALFLPPKFFSSEVALFLHKSTIWPCLDYFCHVKAGNPSWKQVYRAVGLSFVVFT